MPCVEEICLLESIAAARGEFQLTPAQAKAADDLRKTLPVAGVCVLRADPGVGRTSVLRAVARELDAGYMTVRDMLGALMRRSPAEIEEALLVTLESALDSVPIVVVDDLHLIIEVTSQYHYPRRHLLNAVLSACLQNAAREGKRILFGTGHDNLPWSLSARACISEIAAFKTVDYAAVCEHYLRESTPCVDFTRVFRHAPALTCYQLKSACEWLKQDGTITTEAFIEYLTSRNMTANIDLQEVAPVTWQDLKGMDDIVSELEAKVALPFENDSVAAELQLKPKRGVLLAGPPGTGKTTIGRALAHRLKGKFFLIDGTIVAGSQDFFDEVEGIFEAAKRNAPSVIFVDDADVIFENGNDSFYRYLLTMLDGLATGSAQRVCVMLTAMEPRKLPAALLRSGRIELWLETRLPDEAARAAIITEKLAELPEPLRLTNVMELAKASQSLTGADLKSAIEDAKLWFAHDKEQPRPLRRIEDYFLRAFAEIRGNRRRYKTNGKRIGESLFGFPR